MRAAVERLQRIPFVVREHLLPCPFAVPDEHHVGVLLRLFGLIRGVQTSQDHGSAGCSERVGELVRPGRHFRLDVQTVEVRVEPRHVELIDPVV